MAVDRMRVELSAVGHGSSAREYYVVRAGAVEISAPGETTSVTCSFFRCSQEELAHVDREQQLIARIIVTLRDYDVIAVLRNGVCERGVYYDYEARAWQPLNTERHALGPAAGASDRLTQRLLGRGQLPPPPSEPSPPPDPETLAFVQAVADIVERRWAKRLPPRRQRQKRGDQAG